jgi:hypothetical protein
MLPNVSRNRTQRAVSSPEHLLQQTIHLTFRPKILGSVLNPYTSTTAVVCQRLSRYVLPPYAAWLSDHLALFVLGIASVHVDRQSERLAILPLDEYA